MTYRGKIQNGVIVLEEAPKLPEGTEVRVEVERPADLPPPGSPARILQSKARWAGSDEELNELLRQVQQMRDEDLSY